MTRSLILLVLLPLQQCLSCPAEVAFSPDRGAMELVVRIITEAKRSVRFTQGPSPKLCWRRIGMSCVIVDRRHRKSGSSRFSRFKRCAFASSPPATPVSFPEEPMTRWQGAMIATGFLPLAAPTARVARGFPS
jgi:hypothetical protein